MSFKEHLFISDVHIGAFSEEKETEIEDSLTGLIKYAKDNEAALYILGDLFDYWMEYPESDFTPELGLRVLNQFERYNNSVMPAIYVTGNHDNWTFGHFRKRGFDVEPDFRIIDIDNHRVLMMHGDGKFGAREDFLRPKFHQLLRNSTFIHLYQKTFPPHIGMAIMRSFSNLTRRRENKNPLPLNRHARRILNEEQIDVVLCGHDHVPRVETFDGGCYINLGTFCDDRTLVRYNEGKFSLVKWRRESQEFVPFEHNQ